MATPDFDGLIKIYKQNKLVGTFRVENSMRIGNNIVSISPMKYWSLKE